MKDYKLNVLEMVSVLPSKVSVTTSISKSYKNSMGYWEYKEKPKKVVNEKSSLKRKFHNFELSVNSARALRQKTEYLFHYANKRLIKTYSGKKIKNFKVLFLTLTLPSEQIHNTGTIITTALDSFFQICRQRLGMRNYIWRLEFQANGNAHFHILTDTYIDYYFARKHWNKCINQLGYLDNYKNKMSKMTFLDYCNNYGTDYKGGYVSKDILFKRYQNGIKTKWNEPNTVDCKAIKTSKEISYYISKYFSKKSKTAKCNKLDNENNSFAIRLCYWSRSLSRLKLESMPRDYYDADLINLLNQDENVTKCVFDYCTVYYYDFQKLNDTTKHFIGNYLRVCQEDAEYVPAE